MGCSHLTATTPWAADSCHSLSAQTPYSHCCVRQRRKSTQRSDREKLKKVELYAVMGCINSWTKVSRDHLDCSKSKAYSVYFTKQTHYTGLHNICYLLPDTSHSYDIR